VRFIILEFGEDRVSLLYNQSLGKLL